MNDPLSRKLSALSICRISMAILFVYTLATNLTSLQAFRDAIVVDRIKSKLVSVAKDDRAYMTDEIVLHLSENETTTLLKVNTAASENRRTGHPRHTNETNQESERSPLSPNEVMQDYIQWHSTDSLKENEDPNRKYALAYYFCPRRAGNILHSLFISTIWAVLTNRTLLVKYDTDHHHMNTEKECQAVLKRASWIPRWDDWAVRLNLSEPVPVSIDDQNHSVVIFPHIKDVMNAQESFFRVDWHDDPLTGKNNEANLEYIFNMGLAAQERGYKLYRYGVDYIFGMLFRTMFTIQDDVENPFSYTSFDDNVFSLALHSRHTVAGDDGSFISDETKCLREVLPNYTTPETCVVYLMSDRPVTVKLLTDWLRIEANCSTASLVETNATSQHGMITNEHGPNPDAGFIRDLALNSQARSGLIGDRKRSSFMLLMELVTYDRLMQDWTTNKEISDTPMDNLLEFCELPGRYGMGYNYGPGTPNFTAPHHHTQKKLHPYQILERYQEWHSVDALLYRSKDHERLFAITTIPCDMSPDAIQAFCNDLLRAMATNRTLLWRYNVPNEQCLGKNCTKKRRKCDRFINLKRWLPSYTNWKDRIALDKMEPVPWLSSPDPFAEQQLLVTFPYQSRPISQTSLSKYIAHPRRAWKTDAPILDMLYHEGIDYLHGLLFLNSLTMSAVIRDQSETMPPSNSLAFTIALYADDNSPDSVVGVRNCLDQILLNHTGFCQIFVANNKQNRGTMDLPSFCSIFFADPSNLTIAVPAPTPVETVEGVRFFQEMIYVTDHSRSAFVGPSNSSQSDLMLQRIEYLRREEVRKLGRDPPIFPPFQSCLYASSAAKRVPQKIQS